MSKKQQQKHAFFSASMKKSNDCDRKTHTKSNFCFFSGTRRFKNQKLLLDGVLTLSQRTLKLRVTSRRGSGFQSGRNMSFQKEKKKPTEVENTHSVTVIPRLYYLSALTSLSEMASGHLRGRNTELHVWSLCRRSQYQQVENLTKATPDQLRPSTPAGQCSSFRISSEEDPCCFRVHVFRSTSLSDIIQAVLAKVEQLRLHVHIYYIQSISFVLL